MAHYIQQDSGNLPENKCRLKGSIFFPPSKFQSILLKLHAQLNKKLKDEQDFFFLSKCHIPLSYIDLM